MIYVVLLLAFAAGGTCAAVGFIALSMFVVSWMDLVFSNWFPQIVYRFRSSVLRHKCDRPQLLFSRSELYLVLVQTKCIELRDTAFTLITIGLIVVVVSLELMKATQSWL